MTLFGLRSTSDLRYTVLHQPSEINFPSTILPMRWGLGRRPPVRRTVHYITGFRVKSSISIITSSLILAVGSPDKTFGTEVEGVPHSRCAAPFLLSLRVCFSTPSLRRTGRITRSVVTGYLGVLTFAANSNFQGGEVQRIVSTRASSVNTVEGILV